MDLLGEFVSSEFLSSGFRGSGFGVRDSGFGIREGRLFDDSSRDSRLLGYGGPGGSEGQRNTEKPTPSPKSRNTELKKLTGDCSRILAPNSKRRKNEC